jgi:hypothetical protein
MRPLDPYTRNRYIRALTPHLLARQCFTANLSGWFPVGVEKGKAIYENENLVLKGPFPEYGEVSQHFLLPVRDALECIRAFPFRYLYPARRNSAFQASVKRAGRGCVFDHSRDEAFDARFVFRGIVDTGCRLVYSFDSRKVDLPHWLSRLWDPQVLTNPATAIGESSVRYAKDFSGRKSHLRFVPQDSSPYEFPHVLIYAPPERIVELFRLATKCACFRPQLQRGLTQTYGRKPRG